LCLAGIVQCFGEVAGGFTQAPCNADRIFNLGDVAKRALGRKQWAQRDELHRWAAILFRPSGRSVPKTDRSPLPKSRYSSFAPSIGGHAGKQSQAPKQVLGVVTLHAVCEE